MKEQTNAHVQPEEAPPILKTWNRLYAVVFFNLVVLIALFYLFTRIFN